MAWERALGPLVSAAIAVLCVSDTAFWTFSGTKVRQTSLSVWGPYVFMCMIAAAAAVLALGTQVAHRRLRGDRRRWAAFWVACCLAGASALIAADLTLFVALYARLHTVLEVMAWTLLQVAYVMLIAGAARATGRVTRWIARGLSLLAVLWAIVYTAVRPVRLAVEDALQHVWLEEIYAGRMLRRAQDLASLVARPTGWTAPQMERLERLKEKYDLGSTARSPIWDQPFREPEELAQKIKELRKNSRNFNVLFYYVDTLRYDVGADARLMPNTQRFADSALDFVHTYSTGSDTLRGLPGLTGGTYDLKSVKSSNILAVARRAQMPTVLVISQSAHEFLGKLRPSFRFDETLRVRDYDASRKVWGYGADAATAGALVDQAVEWLEDHRDSRFLLWVFNFDLHAWREINEAHIKNAAQRFREPEEGKLPHRYRVVARDIDEHFGRLLGYLEARGLADNTVVVMVADHGEALGQNGFFVHSVFLWESLIHVPLRIRVPGIAPARVSDTVSLVDVAPTLARYLLPDPDMSDYHGEDLLRMLVPGHPPRRLPILAAATSKMDLARIGLIDPVLPYKLVLPFESGVPELYRLQGDDPDRVSVAEQHPARTLKMLNALVQSPVFPRRPDDFRAYIR